MKAFPKTPFVELGTAQNGMDLRDYFAAKALQALVSRGDYSQDTCAVISYQYADAMMRAREK